VERSSPGRDDIKPDEIPGSAWVIGSWINLSIDLAAGQVRRDRPPADKPDPRLARDFEPLEHACEPKWLEFFARNEWSAGRWETITRGEGPGVQYSTLEMEMEISDVVPNGSGMVRAGWPMYCLAGRWAGSTPQVGIVPPTWAHSKPDMLGPRWLPTKPLLGGLACDTALYGATILAGYAGLLGLVRTIRRHAGRCPGCGYDRRGLAAGALCPECGGVPKGGASSAG
jgi:hypothetical protein